MANGHGHSLECKNPIRRMANFKKWPFTLKLAIRLFWSFVSPDRSECLITFLENECLCKPAVFLAKIQFNYANHFYNNGLSCYAVYSFQKYIQSFVSAFPIFQHYILRNAGRNRLQWCWWNMLVKNFLNVGEDKRLKWYAQ